MRSGQIFLLLLVGFGCATTAEDPRGFPEGEANLASICSLCHGSADSPAPPRDTQGNSETSARGVGAHRAHLSGTITTPLGCLDCHLEFESPSDVGHFDSALPAEVMFGERSRFGGAQPEWDGSRCSGVYCHGATQSGGTGTDPVWTTVDGTQSTCGSCHGAPPPLPHPQIKNCSLCHTAVVGAAGDIVDPSLHINGSIDVDGNFACNSCHGSSENPAPPSAISGDMSTSFRGVGAHQSHISAGRISELIACVECHTVPVSTDDAGHLDSDLPAEVIFGDLARSGGASPVWNGTTCADTYCHNPDSDDTNPSRIAAPVWTTVDGTQEECGSCHGYPPWSADHPTRSTLCSNCHSAVVATDNVTILDKSKHINGVVDVDDVNTFACNSCHGSADNEAPPVDLSGNTATTAIGVGAHQAHLTDGALSVAVPCEQCHVVPTTVNEAAHIDGDGIPEVTFLTFPYWYNKTPVWDRATKTCTDTYCHFLPYGSPPGQASTPLWTKVDGTQKQCNSCHRMPPASTEHGNHYDPWNGIGCANCHPTTVDDAGNIIDTTRHIDGQLDIDFGFCNQLNCHPWW